MTGTGGECRSCGRQLDGERFCPACGAAVQPQAASTDRVGALPGHADAGPGARTPATPPAGTTATDDGWGQPLRPAEERPSRGGRRALVAAAAAVAVGVAAWLALAATTEDGDAALTGDRAAQGAATEAPEAEGDAVSGGASPSPAARGPGSGDPQQAASDPPPGSDDAGATSGATGAGEQALTPADALALTPDDAVATLDGAVAADAAAVASLAGSWVPQVSSKCAGLTVDIGPDFFPDGEPETPAVSDAQILAFQVALADRWDTVTTTAAALGSREFPAGCSPERLWVLLAAEEFGSADGALGWCASQGLPRGECGARRVVPPGESGTRLVVG